MRTKFVFMLVVASLGSMAILGTVTFTEARSLLTESALNQLEGLAVTRAERVEALVSDWKDRVRLAASPAQLRSSLREYNEAPTEALRGSIRASLADALAAVESFESMGVHDLEGRLVASADRGDGGMVDMAHEAPVTTPFGEPVVVSTRLIDGLPIVEFTFGLILDDEAVGVLHVFMYGGELLDVTANRGDPGQTGETMIVASDESGEPIYLTPRRFESANGPGVAPGGLAARALAREREAAEDPFETELLDYRGEPVWAAIRPIAETGWRLIVKVDEAEEAETIKVFRQALTEVGTAMAAFAILLGIVVGFRFAKPIHDLAGVATRIRDGELDARAPITGEDEIGLFARTFNDMADELEKRMTLLREYKQFFDASRDMLCIANTDGYFVRINPAFERVLGWTTEDLLDRPFSEYIHPEDVEATAKEVEKLAQGIPTISFENRYRCADGSYKYLRWTTHPEPETGLLFAIARDVTGERTTN